MKIDPEKVVQYGPPAVQALGKLANACIKHWKGAPREVQVELGNACALLNKVVTEESEDGNG